MSAEDPIVSHGRGGQGNIGHDDTKYVDGEIVRQGIVGENATDGAYSTGRGGAANIGGSPGVKATHRNDDEIVPEAALRPSMEGANYHTGRGGEGNVHKAEDKNDFEHDGLADKLKRKLFHKKEKKATEST